MRFNYEDYRLNLHLHDANVQVTTANTTGNNLSPEMKTYYSDYLIDNAKPLLVHDQFGQKHPIPKNGGKIIEFRKYDPFPKALTPLTEGVTPDGRSLNVTTITAEVRQYGDYVTLSDVLLLTAIDNNLVEATELLGQQAGETLDTVTRDIINAGTNVLFAKGTGETRPTARNAITAANTITVDDLFNAARILKNGNTKKIDGSYVGIVCPDISYTLMREEEWIDVHKYSANTEIFEGEIGKIAGIRFVETTEAKKWARNEAWGTGNNDKNTTCDVYSTLIVGANAYGVTEIEGGGLQHIVKQLGSGGTTDPLNQRATAGWKALKVAERLVEPYMIRIESAAK